MARRAAKKGETPQDEIHLPDVKQRRDMLKNALTQIQNSGFEAHINLVVARAQTGRKVQIPTQGGMVLKDKKDHLIDLEETIDNSYRAAKAIEKQLKALPEPEEEPEEPDEPDITPPEKDKD